MSIKYKYPYKNFIYSMVTEKKKFIVGIDCFQWGLGLFIIGNTQSTLLNNLQLVCIPTNNAISSQSLKQVFLQKN